MGHRVAVNKTKRQHIIEIDMTSMSYEEAVRHYPDLTEQILDRFAGHKEKTIDRLSVRWQTVVCHDDPEQPLEEADCADIMLTGTQRCRNGLRGDFGGHFACACDEGCQPATGFKRL